jgi:GNAT superfamily N-acetyltransferase
MLVQDLFEGRDAPLYHATDLTHAIHSSYAKIIELAKKHNIPIIDHRTIAKQSVSEAVEKVAVDGHPVIVLKNPTREQFFNFAEKYRAIRGLLSYNGKNIWLWNAAAAVHSTMIMKLGIEYVYCVFYNDGRWSGPVDDYDDKYKEVIERLTPKPARKYDPGEIDAILKALEDDIFENASGGATGSASVATAVGGLGAGFDNDYSKSIYGKQPKAKKPLIIKRVSEDILDEITLIPDFDDNLNSFRRENRYAEWAIPKTAKKIGVIGEFNLYKNHAYDTDTYYLLDKKKFPMGKANVIKTNGDFYKISHIWFDPSIRGKGYGFKFYEYLLNTGISLVSDYDQTRFSKGVWQKLAQKYTVRPFDKFSGKLYTPIKDTSSIYGTAKLLIATKKPMKESHKIEEINIIGDFDDDILSDDSTYREIMWALPSGAKKVGKIGDLDIFKDNDNYFIVDDTKKTMGKATIAKLVGGYKVSNILFDPSIRGKGYGFKFYEYLLDKGISIISDKKQTRFSQKIWQKLAQKYTVRPYINGRKGDPVDDLSKFYDHSNKTVLLIASINLR